MGTSAFPWDDLLELMLPKHCVVPILGDSLVTIEWQGVQRAFSSVLADQLAAKHGVPSGPLPDLSAKLMKSGIERIQIGLDLNRIQRTLLAQVTNEQIGAPLRQVAQLSCFPLILTTATSALVERAIQASGSQAETLILPMEGCGDLQESWAPSVHPTLVYLFGKLGPDPTFALTEEDILESVCQLQDHRRPEQLVRILRGRHLLFLGTGFPNWLSRMFMRALRDCRPSLDRNTVKAIVEDGDDARAQISVFLQYFASQTWLYTDGSAAMFSEELHRRWLGTQGLGAASPDSASAEAEAMPEGAVFVSYATEDRPRAARIVAALQARGLQAWFDQTDLRAGDQYDSKILRNIKACDLFVALISKQTELRDEAYFLREWRWALERAAAMGPRRSFIVPLVVDELPVATLSNVPDTFKTLTIEQAIDGEISDVVMNGIVQALRSIRSRRALA